MKKLLLYSDGGARGNPGPAGIGAVLFTPDDKVVAEVSHYIGEATNNQAEYKALIAGLEKAKDLQIEEIDCFLDSELIVKQLKGEYKVKNNGLKPLFAAAKNLSGYFHAISFAHVRREKNKHADALVNKAIDAVVE